MVAGRGRAGSRPALQRIESKRVQVGQPAPTVLGEDGASGCFGDLSSHELCGKGRRGRRIANRHGRRRRDGSNHARVLSELPGGVVDPDRKTREHVVRHLKCAGFADLGGLIERGVDAVTIAAPTHLHRDIAIAAHRAELTASEIKLTRVNDQAIGRVLEAAGG